MDGWTQVRWTEARQVAQLMELEEEHLPDEGVAPLAHYAATREAGDRAGAVAFLGHALPRFEAIAWACRILEDEARDLKLRVLDRQALDYSLRWLGDPSDERRRAAMEAADEAGARSPEKLLAMAVFFSGGSIAPPDLPPVLPQPETAGRLASAAIQLAAHRTDHAAAVLDRALDLGEKVAQQGTRALSAS
jgi:hypothetical protein